LPTKKKPAKKVAKKATKKKGVKKTTKKAVKKTAKKTTRKSAPKQLVFASEGESFWAKDGQILNSLVALRDAFERMDKDIYKYHITNDNDFARWVEVVLCDGDCATALRKARTPKTARTVVVKHLKFYEV
jgi:hypothetical protein